MDGNDGNVFKKIPNMDVDSPAFLKRSNSAPMINQLNGTPVSLQPKGIPASFPFNAEPRLRRFSASCSPSRPNYLVMKSYKNVPRPFGRVEQIRQEERSDAPDREIASENKLHNNIRFSQSWEDLSHMLENSPKIDDSKPKEWDTLHLNTSATSWSAASSPSPTRSSSFSRHCYSPIFKPSLSPSPTRKTFATRRSLSPIALRPSSLSAVKRKFDMMMDSEPPAKRYSYNYNLLPSATSRFESASPLPSSTVSSVGTPESIASIDSPISLSFTAPDSPCDQPMSEDNKSEQELGA